MEAIILSTIDIPDMIEKCMAGQAVLRERLRSKDKLKMTRLSDALNQLQFSFSTVSNATPTDPDDGLNKAVSTVFEILTEFQQFELELLDNGSNSKLKTIKSALKRVASNSDDLSEYLDDLTERLFHAVRVFRFAVTLNGYVLYQRDSSLSKMIADENAGCHWMKTFGTNTSSVSFQAMVNFLDSYFTEFGEGSVEYQASCAQCNFFSWYRNEGSWSKCSACKQQLHNALLGVSSEGSAEAKEEVRLHHFAKFCGDNLLLAIRQVIMDAHPWNSEDRFQMVSPNLHREQVVSSMLVGTIPAILDDRRLVFVGHSDHLAELHNQVCNDVFGQSVYHIDSVPDVERFMDWVDVRLAIRQVIMDAHPWNSEDRFQMVSPNLHREQVVSSMLVGTIPAILDDRRLVFVGHSDHLAELHNQVCNDVFGQSVYHIDSVPDVERFMDWVDAHQSELQECKKNQILVVMDCQTQHANCGHSEEGQSSPTSSESLIADGVIEYLTMKKCFNVGLALLTCPFLIHDAQQVKKMQVLLQENFFQTYLLSSDCRKMSKFIHEMFQELPSMEASLPNETSKASPSEEDDFAASMVKANKKSEKDKKKKKTKN
eukprot:TRINITY_DN12193_c0_g1_i2.p1 TRINITY_DN12193_c0_g1~~TRINITY_DN12193_c0_g1_i2.p1  ORF type:complete len:599 (-),score=120.04 TRINITY_DN12193_c0_g1_i2:484-2280(-)